MKRTKIENFKLILKILQSADVPDSADLIAFLKNEITRLENKNLRAQQRQQDKNENGDLLQKIVWTVLTDKEQSIDEIIEKINLKGLSRAKVIARLNNLVDKNYIIKVYHKDKFGTKHAFYKLYR